MSRLAMNQSLRSPGLPGIPPKRVPFWSRPMYIGPDNHLPTPRNSKLIPIDSINFDYLPTSLDSPKVFWMQLRFPAPNDLRVGSTVLLKIVSPNSQVRKSLQNQKFGVTDIFGTRVVLSPYRGNDWLPTLHGNAPQGWGYNTDLRDVRTSLHSWNYGYGKPVAYIEYYPY